MFEKAVFFIHTEKVGLYFLFKDLTFNLSIKFASYLQIKPKSIDQVPYLACAKWKHSHLT